MYLLLEVALALRAINTLGHVVREFSMLLIHSALPFCNVFVVSCGHVSLELRFTASMNSGGTALLCS